MSKRENIVILDFDGENGQFLSRLVRDSGVYSQLYRNITNIEKVLQSNPIGIIISGYNAKCPINPILFDADIPFLVMGKGLKYLSEVFGQEAQDNSSHDKQNVTYPQHKLLKNIDTNDINTNDIDANDKDRKNIDTNDRNINDKDRNDIDTKNIDTAEYKDTITQPPKGFISIAYTKDRQNLVIQCQEKNIFGTQIFPYLPSGQTLIVNFLYEVCKAKGKWDMASFAKEQIATLQTKLKDKKVLLGLSGGVDSSVCAAILHKAAKEGLKCVFVNHGLLRKGEVEEVQSLFGSQFGDNLIVVDAETRFLNKLKGISDPEQKRKIIGNEFIKVFEEEAKKIGKVDFLAQGTIYPDIVESGAVEGEAVIKSHHNVGGLPSVVDFEEIIEPLRDLFKDEVRKVGFELGLPEHIVMRQPFPGPGLGIRVIGEVTKQKLEILKDADYIYREEIAKAGLDKKIWQYFAVITDMRSVGVTKGGRTYDYTIALRAVSSVDAMSAEWYRVPFDVLDRCSHRIIKEVKGVNRVVYDITSKPPATIEWE